METVEQRLFRFLSCLKHIHGWKVSLSMDKSMFTVGIFIGYKERGGYAEVIEVEGSHDLVPMLCRRLDEARLTKAERDQLAGILPIFAAPQENG